MENKIWLWRKRSSEKIINAATHSDFSSKGNDAVMLPTEKEVNLERALGNLNEKLASVLCESNTKDELLARHVKMAEEAITGLGWILNLFTDLWREKRKDIWRACFAHLSPAPQTPLQIQDPNIASTSPLLRVTDVWLISSVNIFLDREKAEAEAVSLKQKLEKALQQKADSNEKLTQLNAALKESMQQLTSVREELDQRIYDAVMKISKELEKTQKKLEEKLTEKSKRLSNLTVENNRLSKTLLVKEKLIEDLSECKYQVEVEFNALMARLDSVEKENAFVKYEFHMLEKEVEIRTEESEFIRQSADVAHNHYIDSLKKNAKLEKECQRLQILLRKRFPGPAALGMMKSELEVIGRNQPEMRRRKPNLITGSFVLRGSSLQTPEDIHGKISFLIDRLRDLEEENKTLKEILAKKDDELHFSEVVCTQTSSKLSMIEDQLEKLSKVQKPMEITHFESRASALISELDNFRDRSPKTPHEHKSFGVSDMSLMDDFVEMEKLAIVTVGTPQGSSCASFDANNALAISLENSGGYDSDARGTELVSVEQEGCDWLQKVLNLILDQTHLSKRSFDDLFEDIRMALNYMKHSCASEANRKESSTVPISGYITWKSPTVSPRVGLLNGVLLGVSSVREKTNRHLSLDTSPRASELDDRVHDPISESNCQKVRLERDLPKENRGLKHELKNTDSLLKELEARLSLANDKNEDLINQLRESEQSLGELKMEINLLKESKGIMEDQIEHQRLVNEELDTQLTVAKAKLNEVVHKFSSLEVKLDDKSHCCEELETTCRELQLQLEREVPKDSTAQEERLLQTGWEITAASAKLAQCQETILSLGKQLKALSSPKDSITTTIAAVASTNNKKLSQHPSLRDQMLAEDGDETKDSNSPKTPQLISTVEAKKPSFLPSKDALSLAIVASSKKRGGQIGFLKKLLLRKRGSGKKTLQLFAA